MNKFFSICISVVALSFFSTVSLAQSNSPHPKKAKVASRKVVEAAPKRRISAGQKKIATVHKPMVKKSVRKVATPKKAKARVAAKGKYGRSLFWKMALNPVAMVVWIPLFLTGVAIIIQIFRLFPKREPEVSSTVVEEKAEEDAPSWDQKLWDRIKDIFRKLRKKPALAAC